MNTEPAFNNKFPLMKHKTKKETLSERIHVACAAEYTWHVLQNTRGMCCRIHVACAAESVYYYYLFIIPEFRQSGYGTCHYIIIGIVQKSRNT